MILRRVAPKPLSAPILCSLLSILLVSGCGQERSSRGAETVDGDATIEASVDSPVPTDLTGIPIIPERWVSAWDTTANLDSPAYWAGDTEAWVVTTAKGTHDLWVHDASNGELVRRVGRMGTGPGEFNYPNGIAVVGDLVLVTERDNHRVQVLSLPDFESLGTFGEESLDRPYGIAFLEASDGSLTVYVTDDYGNGVERPDGVAPTGDFTRRIKEYRVVLSGGVGAPEDSEPIPGVQAALVRSFGEADGPGAILVAESIQVDEDQGILLVADEFSFELEVYDLDGRYLGQTVGAGLYSHGDPEGIMLYRCGGDGYWILTDQGLTRSVFHVLDRVSMEHLGSFAGEVTANTDGIWLDQGLVPGVGQGALFALHDDGGLSAFAWEDIAGTLDLSSGCDVQVP